MKKESKYNHFIEKENLILAYNARTNALAEITKEDYIKFEKAKVNNFENLNFEFIRDLEYGGFIIDSTLNELDMFRHDMFLSRFSTQQLGLTIAPTSNCNFRCPYCYEKEVLRHSSMTDETANNIIKFVEKEADHVNLLSITWYGGEPLLELSRIKSLTYKFKEICDKNNIQYQAQIVTNGFLLNKQTLHNLISLNITSIQITLDGSKEYHDQTRYLINKKPTFDIIIDNIKSFKTIKETTKNFPTINIRMNISKSNIKGCKPLINHLHKNKLDEYVDFYPAIVTDLSDKEFKNVYNTKEFELIKQDIKLYKELNGWRYPKQIQYPELKSNSCVCDIYNSYVIDSDGEIYKCWELMGNRKNSIGNINNPPSTVTNHDYYSNILEDPTKDEKCKNCSILPVCNGGGCPIYRKKYNYKPNCGNYKKSVINQVVETYNVLLNNKR